MSSHLKKASSKIKIKGNIEKAIKEDFPLRVSHVVPIKLGGHLHANLFPRLMHIPPLLQEDGSQGELASKESKEKKTQYFRLFIELCHPSRQSDFNTIVLINNVWTVFF